MNVKVGWSAEVANSVWDKCDVELDNDDYRDILRELRLEDLPRPIESQDKFLLMQNHGQRLICAHVMVAHPDLRDNARNKLSLLDQAREQYVLKIKEKSGNALSE